MRVCLDLHDWSVVHNRLDLLLKLKAYFPKFKVSLFTVPADKEKSFGPYQIRNDLLKEIRKHLTWIQIVPHGLMHEHSEVKNCSYKEFKHTIIPAVEYYLGRDKLPFVHGFCAPHWRWNKQVVKVLDEMNWWGAVDRRQPKMLKTKKFYAYSHCIDEPFGKSKVLKLHGHVYGTKNDLGKCFNNLLTLPVDTDWHFVTDFLEER